MSTRSCRASGTTALLSLAAAGPWPGCRWLVLYGFAEGPVLAAGLRGALPPAGGAPITCGNAFPEKSDARNSARSPAVLPALRTGNGRNAQAGQRSVAAELHRRVRFTNPEVLERLPGPGPPWYWALSSHLGNWEWVLAGAAVRFPGQVCWGV
ncbi:MAG: hypothetical protein WKG07_00525 [Hymenobacter sp.]